MQRLTGGMRTLRVPALLVVAWVVGLATATAQEGHCPGLPVPAWGAVVTRPACLTRAGTQSPEQVVVAARLTEEDIFARLVFAEGVSTNWGQEPACARQAHAILHRIFPPKPKR